MPLDIQKLAERATRKARGGYTEAEAGIDVARAALLIPESLHELATKVAMDGEKRDLLRTEWTVTLTNGVADLSVSGYDYLLKEALQYSTAFDLTEDPDRKTPLVFKRHAHQLNWGTHLALGYYAFEQDTLLTRQKGSGSPTSMTSMALIANYVPALGTNAPTPNPYVIPPELEDDIITILAEKLVEGAKLKM
jgi:hypothetical protein